MPVEARTHAGPFLHTVSRPPDLASRDERSWLAERAPALMAGLASGTCGAVHLRGFETPRTPSGFRHFCAALPLQACCDPLSSIGVRSLLSASDGVYEAVDAPSLADTHIGLHNDATFTLAAPYACFVCFRKAASGGAFLVADGRQVLRSLPPRLVDTLQRRKLRVRVAALPVGMPLRVLPARLQPPLRDLIASLARFGLVAALPKLRLDAAWSADGAMLQVFEQPKPAVNVHPTSGAPSFFSGIDSQSAYLQRKRAEAAGGRTFEGVASTDVMWGDDGSPIETEVLEAIEEAVRASTVRLLMAPGDVVLLDTYTALHGRESFNGPRQHAVQWLTHAAGEVGAYGDGVSGASGDGGGTRLGGLINRLAVKGRGVPPRDAVDVNADSRSRRPSPEDRAPER